MVLHKFTYNKGTPNTVIVTGTFNNWAKDEVLTKEENSNIFSKEIDIPVKQKIFYSGKIESQSYYIIYELNFLKEKVEKKFEEDINYILVQVPVEKNTEKLNITMERSETEEYYMSDISQRIKTNNCFFSLSGIGVSISFAF